MKVASESEQSGSPINGNTVKRIREKYPVGCTVELIEMCDPYRDMPAGLRGTVTHVDDTGTVFADWENGSTLGAVFGEDRIRRVD